MCLAAFASGLSSRLPFVLLANRDESFDRAAAPMAWWRAPDADTHFLAGRDLSAGGTWLGLTAAGRLALVTNVREPGRVLPGSPSRGALVPLWLQARHAVQDGAALQTMCLAPRNGFNLLVADLVGRQGTNKNSTEGDAVAHWLSNRPLFQQRGLGPGVHGMSNAALDTPWPKLVLLKRRLHDILGHAQDLPTLQAEGFAALADPQVAADAQLPATGLPLLRVRSQEAMRKKPGRTENQRGFLEVRDGQLVVRITGAQGSGILRSMSEANCFIVLGHDQDSVKAGDAVDVMLFDGLV